MTRPMDQIRRHRERARHERADLDAVLDAGHHVGTLSTVAEGRPWVVPMLYGRAGDRILMHGSTGAGALRHAAAGAWAALCVTHMDGWVYGHTMFNSSANYRSAVVHGRLIPLSGDDAVTAMTQISECLTPGRPGRGAVPHAEAAGGHHGAGHGYHQRSLDGQGPRRRAGGAGAG